MVSKAIETASKRHENIGRKSQDLDLPSPKKRLLPSLLGQSRLSRSRVWDPRAGIIHLFPNAQNGANEEAGFPTDPRSVRASTDYKRVT